MQNDRHSLAQWEEERGDLGEASKSTDSRRDFLEKASAALVILGAPSSESTASEAGGNPLFQPEEKWADRFMATWIKASKEGLQLFLTASEVASDVLNTLPFALHILKSDAHLLRVAK